MARAAGRRLLGPAAVAVRVPGLARGLRAAAASLPQLSDGTLKVMMNASYICSGVALMLGDVLFVRAVMMLGQSTSIAVCMLRAEPLVLPARWGAFFFSVNGYHVLKLMLENRPLTLTEEEAGLYAHAFQPHEFSPREFLRMMEAGSWVDIAEGTDVTRHGEQMSKLLVIHKGAATVLVDGRTVGRCDRSNFVGEMSFLSRVPKAACATVRTTAPVRAVQWDRAELHALLDGDAALMAKIKESITADVMRKLDADHGVHDHGKEATMRVALAGSYLSPESRDAIESLRAPGFDFDAALHGCGWTPEEFARGARRKEPRM